TDYAQAIESDPARKLVNLLLLQMVYEGVSQARIIQAGSQLRIAGVQRPLLNRDASNAIPLNAIAQRFATMSAGAIDHSFDLSINNAPYRGSFGLVRPGEIEV